MLAQLVQSAALTGQRSAVRARYVLLESQKPPNQSDLGVLFFNCIVYCIKIYLVQYIE